MKRYRITAIILIFIIQISGCAVFKPHKPTPIPGPDMFPEVSREFRAAWVATVANIDWPSRPGLSADSQKTEIIAILDTAAALKLNAIVLQVRPQCDALYESDLEPWSYYLTGEQGKPPEPFYDPLAFWIEEAHNRGMELHAWFNPYRAHHPSGGPITEKSIVSRRPDLARRLRAGYAWLDPAMRPVQDYSYEVIMDVVRRYNLDGVHFDDYFYPYADYLDPAGDGIFPDHETWEAYRKSGGKLSRDDWRREAVNQFIQRVYRGIKKEKPWVKFGLSPFGIYRPYHPLSIRGMDQYAVLYADALHWLQMGWIDYWTPQLYWPIARIAQSFPVLLGWWSEENIHNRHLWPGLYTSNLRGEEGVTEIINEIMVVRGFIPDSPGHVHFSMRALMDTARGMSPALKTGPYQTEALVPPTPWLSKRAPSAPDVSLSAKGDLLTVSWSHEKPEDVFRHVLYIRKGRTWTYRILNRNAGEYSFAILQDVKQRDDSSASVSPSELITEIAVSAVDRTGNESRRTHKMLPSNVKERDHIKGE